MHKGSAPTQPCAGQSETAWLHKALHDLAQPVTAIECGLFLTTLEQDANVAELRNAIGEALGQCQRLMREVRAMQERLQVWSS